MGGGEHARSQSLARDGLLAMKGEIGHHLYAATAKCGREGLNESDHLGIGAQEFHA